MAEGRDRQIWTQTACLASIIVNSSGNLKKGANITPNHFDPYYRKAKEDVDPKVTWQMMQKMFDKSDRRKRKKQDAFPSEGGKGVCSSAPPSLNESELNNE